MSKTSGLQRQSSKKSLKMKASDNHSSKPENEILSEIISKIKKSYKMAETRDGVLHIKKSMKGYVNIKMGEKIKSDNVVDEDDIFFGDDPVDEAIEKLTLKNKTAIAISATSYSVYILLDNFKVAKMNLKESGHHKGMTIEVPTFFSIKQIACGSSFLVVLTTIGKIFIRKEEGSAKMKWLKETNSFEEYSLGASVDSAIFITAGINFIYAISNDRELYSWGDNSYGQLGANLPVDEPIILPLHLKIEYKCQNVAAGKYHVGALCDERIAYFSGFNASGQLGTGDQQNVTVLQINKEFYVNSVSVISCGLDHTMGISQNGRVFGMGSNAYYKAGAYSELLEHTLDQYILVAKEVDFRRQEIIADGIIFASDEIFINIYCFTKCTYGVTNKDKLYAWGYHMQDLEITERQKNSCILCLKEDFSAEAAHSETKQVKGSKIQHENIFCDIACGRDFGMSLTGKGEVWVWGSNNYCQHVLDENQIQQFYDDAGRASKYKLRKRNYNISFSKVPLFGSIEKRPVTKIAAGTNYALVLEDDNIIFGWGDNRYGQLGIGCIRDLVSEPTLMVIPAGNRIKKMAAGDNHTIVLTNKNKIFSCGSNKDGKLGVGIILGSSSVYTPLEIKELSERTAKVQSKTFQIVDIACSANHSMALVSSTGHTRKHISKVVLSADGEQSTEIYAWGEGKFGKLGNKAMFIEKYPKLIDLTGLSFQKVFCGFNHSAALTDEGVLYVWGSLQHFPLHEREWPEHDHYHVVDLKLDKEAESSKQKCLLFPKKSVCFAAEKKKKITDVSLGFQSNLYITDDGAIIEEKFGEKQMNEIALESREAATKVFCTHNDFNLGLIENGNIITWGIDYYSGRLGQNVEMIKSNRNKKKNNVKGESDDIILSEPTQLSVLAKLSLEADKKEMEEAKDNLNESKNLNSSVASEKSLLSGSKTNASEAGFAVASSLIDENLIFFRYKQLIQKWEEFLEEFKNYHQARVGKKSEIKEIKKIFEDKLLDYPFSLQKNLKDYASENDYPECIKINMQHYRLLFSILSSHSCLLIELAADNMFLKNISDVLFDIIGIVDKNRQKMNFLAKINLFLMEKAHKKIKTSDESYWNPENQGEAENEYKKQYMLLYYKFCQQEPSIKLWIHYVVNKFEVLIENAMMALDEKRHEHFLDYDQEPDPNEGPNARNKDYKDRSKNITSIITGVVDHMLAENKKEKKMGKFLAPYPLFEFLRNSFKFWLQKTTKTSGPPTKGKFKEIYQSSFTMLFYPVLRELLDKARAASSASGNEKEKQKHKIHNYPKIVEIMYAVLITKEIKVNENLDWIKSLNEFIKEPLQDRNLAGQGSRTSTKSTSSGKKAIYFQNPIREKLENYLNLNDEETFTRTYEDNYCESQGMTLDAKTIFASSEMPTVLFSLVDIFSKNGYAFIKLSSIYLIQQAILKLKNLKVNNIKDAQKKSLMIADDENSNILIKIVKLIEKNNEELKSSKTEKIIKPYSSFKNSDEKFSFKLMNYEIRANDIMGLKQCLKCQEINHQITITDLSNQVVPIYNYLNPMGALAIYISMMKLDNDIFSKQSDASRTSIIQFIKQYPNDNANALFKKVESNFPNSIIQAYKFTIQTFIECVVAETFNIKESNQKSENPAENGDDFVWKTVFVNLQKDIVIEKKRRINFSKRLDLLEIIIEQGLKAKLIKEMDNLKQRKDPSELFTMTEELKMNFNIGFANEEIEENLDPKNSVTKKLRENLEKQQISNEMLESLNQQEKYKFLIWGKFDIQFLKGSGVVENFFINKEEIKKNHNFVFSLKKEGVISVVIEKSFSPKAGGLLCFAKGKKYAHEEIEYEINYAFLVAKAQSANKVISFDEDSRVILQLRSEKFLELWRKLECQKNSYSYIEKKLMSGGLNKNK